MFKTFNLLSKIHNLKTYVVYILGEFFTIVFISFVILFFLVIYFLIIVLSFLLYLILFIYIFLVFSFKKNLLFFL